MKLSNEIDFYFSISPKTTIRFNNAIGYFVLSTKYESDVIYVGQAITNTLIYIAKTKTTEEFIKEFNKILSRCFLAKYNSLFIYHIKYSFIKKILNNIILILLRRSPNY